MRASAGRTIAAALRRRLYSTQAAAAEESSILPKQAPQVTKLPNGAVVASVENYAPVSQIAVVFNAGARFETGTDIGMNHCLRRVAELSNGRSSGFKLTRSLQQIGGSLACSSTRENMVYSLDCIRDNVDVGVQYLSDVTTAPDIRHWELPHAKQMVQLDLAFLEDQPEIRLIEAVHKAAYRNTLGNSLYVNPLRLGSITPQQIEEYMTNNFQAGRMAIVGIGIDHDTLVKSARSFSPLQGSAPEQQAKFLGGEQRIETINPFVHAAIVTEGAGYSNKDLVPLLVLQNIMGTGPRIKYSNNMTSSKAMQAAAQGTSAPFAASCINATYSDSGIFGFHVVGHSQDMGKILKSLVGQFSSMTKGGITDQDVQRGKNQLKSSIAMEMESGAGQLAVYSEQAMFGGELSDANSMIKAVDAVTTADVQGVAKKVINGKPAMAAVGDLSSTPYLDELMK